MNHRTPDSQSRFRMWLFGALAGLTLSLTTTTTTAQAGPLTAQQREQVEAAIAILEAYENNCNPVMADGFSPNMTIVNCLKQIFANGNICGGAPQHAYGQLVGDTSANCTGNDKILLKYFGSSKTRTGFVVLMIALYHEATHALQDLSKVTTQNYKDKVTGPLEVQAFQNHTAFARSLEAALDILYTNIKDDIEPRDTGMDDCQKALMACYLEEGNASRIKRIRDRARTLTREGEKILESVQEWLAKHCPDDAPETGSPRPRRAESTAGPRWAITGPDDDDILYIEEPADEESLEDPGYFDLDTGLTEIFGLAFQTDASGFEHLIVSGQRDGSGVVQIWRDTTLTAIDTLILQLELDVDPFVPAPSSLVPFGDPTAPGGLLVWDETGASLRALIDTDGDLIVDTLDPTERYRLSIPADTFVRLEWIGGDEYRFSNFAVGSMAGVEPVLTVFDSDANGIFDGIDQNHLLAPLDDPRLAPSFNSAAMAGVPQIYAAGVQSHSLELWQTDGAGSLVQQLSPTTTIAVDNEAALIPDSPLVAGTWVAVLDLDNGKLSVERQVAPLAPSVDRAIGNRSPGSGGAIVFQRGTQLDSLQLVDVLVGGASAPAFGTQVGGIWYEAPANQPVAGNGIADKGHVTDVRLVHLVGTETRSLSAQALSYSEPRLTPEYECRKGNVNGGAGEVRDVLLVNGTPGIGNARQVFIDRDAPLDIVVQAPPSNPSGPAPFALYAWIGAPNASSVMPVPRATGTICRSFLDGAGGPKRLANNTGIAQLGVEHWPGPPSQPAPAVVLNLPGGLGKVGTFTFQGIVIDSNAPNGLAAVTNAAIIVSE